MPASTSGIKTYSTMQVDMTLLGAGLALLIGGVILFVLTSKSDDSSGGAAKTKVEGKKTKKSDENGISSASKISVPVKEAPNESSVAFKEESGATEPVAAKKKKKKNKNKDNGTIAVEDVVNSTQITPQVPATTSKPATTPVSVLKTETSKTMEERSAEEASKARKKQEMEDSRTAARLAESEYNSSMGITSTTSDAGWEVAQTGKKGKKKGGSSLALASASASESALESAIPMASISSPPPGDAAHHLGLPAMQVSSTQDASEPDGVAMVTKSVQIENRKLGIIIGPKGVTKIAIQTATNTEIITPRQVDVDNKDSSALVTVDVVGNVEWEVNAAIRAVKDMAMKGYCALLGGENFSEGSISVHSTFLPELIGKGGSVLKAVQNHYNVKLTVPQMARDAKVDCKVMVVGDKKDVKKAKECIKVLNKYHHTEVTHPGLCHDELELEAATHRFIIGHRGSEIHHIQKNFKVAVHIPGPYSLHENVLVVGEPDGVMRAVAYINKIVEKAMEPKQSAEDMIAAEAAAAASAVVDDDDVLEPWMETYTKDGGATSQLSFNI